MGMMRNIVVVDYRPQWPAEFEAESGQIRRALSSVLVAIHHIGSTSVMDLAAKPIIDMLAEVRSLGELDDSNDAMIAIGYEPRGEFGIAGRRFFVKGSDVHRTHHVHAFEAGHSDIEKHLVFRDYLRAHPAEAVRYAELKAELAGQYRHDIEAYMEGKDPLIQELLRRASQWRASNVPAT